MEELRSTDVLDREIELDAQRKAKRILEKADETASALLDEVDSRIAESHRMAEKTASHKARVYEKNITASIPLEKERYTVSYINSSIIDAMNKYFKDLGSEKRLLIIENLLKRSLDPLKNSCVSARYTGFEKSQVEGLLKTYFGERLNSVAQCPAQVFAAEAVSGFDIREGIILTSDSGVTCRLSLDQKVKEIMDADREELCTALFGGRVAE